MFTFSFDIRAIKATAIAASNEETRYYLKGVCIEHTPDGPIFVATDGHRLIATTHKWAIPRADYFAHVIIPLSLIKRIKINRKIDQATMTIEPKEKGAFAISIYYAGATYIENAIDGTFPIGVASCRANATARLRNTIPIISQRLRTPGACWGMASATLPLPYLTTAEALPLCVSGMRTSRLNLSASLCPCALTLLWKRRRRGLAMSSRNPSRRLQART